MNPSFPALRPLFKPGLLAFIESAVHNALYLWLIDTIMSVRLNYTIGFGIFNGLFKHQQSEIHIFLNEYILPLPKIVGNISTVVQALCDRRNDCKYGGRRVIDY